LFDEPVECQPGSVGGYPQGVLRVCRAEMVAPAGGEAGDVVAGVKARLRNHLRKVSIFDTLSKRFGFSGKSGQASIVSAQPLFCDQDLPQTRHRPKQIGPDKLGPVDKVIDVGILA
jgi:hypothetical protein